MYQPISHYFSSARTLTKSKIKTQSRKINEGPSVVELRRRAENWGNFLGKMDDYTREMMDLKTLVTRTLEKKGVLAKIRVSITALFLFLFSIFCGILSSVIISHFFAFLPFFVSLFCSRVWNLRALNCLWGERFRRSGNF